MHAQTSYGPGRRIRRILGAIVLACGLGAGLVDGGTTSAAAAVGHVRIEPGMTDASPLPTLRVPRRTARRQAAAELALHERGVPYSFGGSTPSGFDCSGLIAWAYGQLGLTLPHSTDSLWSLGTRVTRRQLEAGDLVFFYGESHVGLYIGGGRFVHAPRPGEAVRVARLTDPWFSSGYDGAVRF